MTNNIQLAKEIFIKYGGNKFYMEREGEYALYKSFDISKDQEVEWITEYHKEIVTKIKAEKNANTFITMFNELSNSIILFKDIDSFESILDIVKEKNTALDSFTRLRMTEETYNIVDALSKNSIKKNIVLTNAKKLILEILDSIIKTPITIDNDYYRIGYLEDMLNNHNIINRVKILIQMIKS